jgi:UPF0716 family protein affecting phage T7 exclusion
MLKSVVIIVVLVLLVVEIALLMTMKDSVDWRIMLAQGLLTAVLGILVILRMPARWKEAMHTDPAWLWAGQVSTGEHAEVDLAQLEARVRADARKGYLFVLAGLLLIIPGLISDLLGLGLLLWLAAVSLWRRDSGRSG